MKVTEHLDRADRPLISFEIIPPLRGGRFSDLENLIEDLVRYNPPFIDITSHAAEVVYEETANGISKKIKRKRPGTLGVCALIQKKYGIDAVPHVLCHGFTREETEDVLIELRYLGIDNVLALRGDTLAYVKPIEGNRTVNQSATDLVSQIAAMNRGQYIEDDLLDADPSEFCIGVAGYPEKHFEAPNLKTDLVKTKQKIDAGASYIVTQMFFDNQKFFEYEKACRGIGIDVPIIPGLKILTSKRQLTHIPGHFHIDLPTDLTDEVLAARPQQAADIGVEWAVRQVEDLFAHGVPAVHLFVMQSSRIITRVLDALKI